MATGLGAGELGESAGLLTTLPLLGLTLLLGQFLLLSALLGRRLAPFGRLYRLALGLGALQLLLTLETLALWEGNRELPLLAPTADGSLPALFSLSLSPLKLFFLLLVDLLLPLVLLAFGAQRLEQRPGRSRRDFRTVFLWLLLSLQLLLHLFFLSENLLLFFVTFELSVLPVFAIVGFFGKRSQKFKAMKYLLYFTLFSGVPLLYNVAYFQATLGTLQLGELELLLPALLADGSSAFALVSLGGFLLPFAVKAAAFPFHSWLPEAHVEASTEGSMLLSGIMLKLGFYGLLRCALGFYGEYFWALAPLALTLALLGALLTSLSMYAQVDIKKIIAYSSVVHMNLALLGFWAASPTALGAALLMSFSHGLISAALFLAVGILQDSCRSRNLLELAGLWIPMPRWCGCFGLLLLANAGMPGTLGFLAEFPFLVGLFEQLPLLGLTTLLPVALAALRNFILFSQLALGVPTLASGYALDRPSVASSMQL